MVELRPGGKDHRDLPSNVGRDDAHRPEWIGVAPELNDRRAYLRSYLRWSNDHGSEWLKHHRAGAERMTARARVDEGELDIGQHRWDCMVDSTLWNMSFANVESKTRVMPKYPWKGSSNTDGGFSAHYRTLRREYLAELQTQPARQVEASLETKDGQKLKPLPRKDLTEQKSGNGKGVGAKVPGTTAHNGPKHQNAVAGPSGTKGPGSTKGPVSKPHLAGRKPPLVEAKTPAPLVRTIPDRTRMSFAALSSETPAPGMTGQGEQGKSWADTKGPDASAHLGLLASIHAPANRPGAKGPVQAEKPKAEAAVVKVTPEVKPSSGVVAKKTESPSTVVKQPEKPKAENKAEAKDDKAKKDKAKDDKAKEDKAKKDKAKKDRANVEPASPKKQTGVAIMQHEGKLYWQPPAEAPDLKLRQRTYDNMCFGGETVRKNPFELELPGYFAFEELARGEDGADWDYIQRLYLWGDARFTWGYKGGIPEKAVPFTGKVDKSRMANVGYVLTVGRATDKELPHEDDNILTVWKIVMNWYNLWRDGKARPLVEVFHSYAMSNRRIGSRPPAPAPVDMGPQARDVRERTLRTAQVKKIVDEGGDDVGGSLEKWLAASSDSYLPKADLIEMASFVWFRDATDKDELDWFKVEKWRMAMFAKGPK